MVPITAMGPMVPITPMVPISKFHRTNPAFQPVASFRSPALASSLRAPLFCDAGMFTLQNPTRNSIYPFFRGNIFRRFRGWFLPVFAVLALLRFRAGIPEHTLKETMHKTVEHITVKSAIIVSCVVACKNAGRFMIINA